MAAPGILIVGTGFFARAHAEALGRQQRLRLAGFAGPTPDSTGLLAREFGANAYHSYAEALADPAVAAVILATPHATHFPLGIAAIEAGRSVLIEKPLALDAAQCDALMAAEAESPGRGMVGHLMRWAPPHVQARALIEAGAIGEVASAESRRVIPWRAAERRPRHKSAAAGGGMWLVQGVHVVDQLTHLLGHRAGRVVGLSETRFHPAQDADDFGLALARFGEIPVSITIADTGEREAEIYTEITGSKGALRVSHRGQLLVDTGTGWQDRYVPGPADPASAMLDAEIAAFADLVERGVATTDFGYGRYVVGFVDAVRRSARSGQWEDIQ